MKLSPPRYWPCCASGNLPNEDNLNVNGSGISLGHPIAATGARILATMLHEMERRDLHSGDWKPCASAEARVWPPCSSASKVVVRRMARIRIDRIRTDGRMA